MNVGAEALGEAVIGGMAARSVEPDAGEAEHGHGGACLNCGAALGGNYCASCGQPAHVHRSVAAWWHDLAHGVLHFEGKTWRTLPMLAWRPGELTRRYIEGQRARFVSPMALFLFTVFLMFAVMGALSMPLVNFGGGDDPAATAAAADEQLAELRQEQREMRANGQNPAVLDPAVRAVEAAQAEAARPRAEGAEKGQRERLFGENIHTGWPRLDHGLKKANENPALLSYKLQSSAYKYSWALIPLSLPFLWLLFLHRRRYRRDYKAYDHLIFITYSISFMSMLLIVLAVLTASALPVGLLQFALVLAVPVHIFRHLKGAYALRACSALWRTVALLVFAGVTLTLFAVLLLGLGLLA